MVGAMVSAANNKNRFLAPFHLSRSREEIDVDSTRSMASAEFAAYQRGSLRRKLARSQILCVLCATVVRSGASSR